MKRFFKIPAALLASVLLFSSIAACDTDSNTDGTTTAGTTAGTATPGTTDTEEPDDSESEGTEGPNERIQLTILKAKAANEVNYDDMFIFDDMSEKFNIDFVWDNPSEQDFLQRYNLMMSNPDELPDIIMNMPLEDVQRHADGGLIIPLNDIIEANNPNLKGLFDADDRIERAMTYPDGNIYWYPMIDEMPSGNMPFGVRLDWLDKLGIEERPETLEEWEAYWEGVMTEDLNGNGDAADEIPFSAGSFSSVRAFASAFGVVDNADSATANFYNDPEESKIKYGPITDNYKEFLIWANDMYSKGYIDPQIITMTDEIYQSAVAQNLVGSLRGPLGGNFVNFNAQMPENIEGFKLAATHPPKGPEGKQIHINIDQYPRALAAASFTNTMEHEDRAAEWIDYLYGEEGALLSGMGHEGETYVLEDGIPVYSDFIQKNPDGLSPKQAAGTFSWVQSSGPYLFIKYAPMSLDDASVLEAKEDYIIPHLDESNKYVLPGALAFDNEAAEVIRSRMTDIKDTTDQAVLAFINGQRSIDEFDAFVSQIEGLGIQEVIDIYQASHDAWLGK